MIRKYHPLAFGELIKFLLSTEITPNTDPPILKISITRRAIQRFHEITNDEYKSIIVSYRFVPSISLDPKG